MPAYLIRPFRRDDRDQLTRLANTHIAAVVPGVSISVNTMLSSLERRPEEVILDPWVIERVTLVAEQDRELVAAAHLLRYDSGAHVTDSFRNAGTVEWFLAWNRSTLGDDGSLRPVDPAADALMTACLAQFAHWRVASRRFSGNLPTFAAYGLSEQWPHIRAVLERNGWSRADASSVELLLLAETDRIPRPQRPDLAVRREMGELGTRFIAHRDGHDLGYLEVDTNLTQPERMSRLGGWADVCREDGEPEVLRWLYGQVADWLRLGGVDRLLTYSEPGDPELELLARFGFVELTRTDRSWAHPG
ncbi:N-acetyltransferase [Nocardia cyriacigeorgica]|uniref:N-acetyltransferase n=1 Tax=Nocardia cyriacigeorgica TaxID=135487 RepID=UPI00189521A7|nr:N-acetyltransferase [Nocardia cyriacigeorgica]MBF6089283.1 N-acetyltransferase [Nocardia cyriacigeorgica]MBF6093857.1 N-acetyltransferase [Nocardia cyriacigeorgica]